MKWGRCDFSIQFFKVDMGNNVGRIDPSEGSIPTPLYPALSPAKRRILIALRDQGK